MEWLGLFGYFDVIIMVEDVMWIKLDLDLFLEVLRVLDVKLLEVFIVEDLWNGFLVGNSVGVNVFVILNEVIKYSDLILNYLEWELLVEVDLIEIMVEYNK